MLKERVRVVASGCKRCCPEAVPRGPRLYPDDNHVAERFGDGDHIKIFLGDREITDAFEAIRKDHRGRGFIWRFVMETHAAETQIVTCRVCGSVHEMFFVEERDDIRIVKTLVQPRLARLETYGG